MCALNLLITLALDLGLFIYLKPLRKPLSSRIAENAEFDNNFQVHKILRWADPFIYHRLKNYSFNRLKLMSWCQFSAKQCFYFKIKSCLLGAFYVPATVSGPRHTRTITEPGTELEGSVAFRSF